ncbi:MAG: hypothetical protein HY235_23635 [Acidobacteria bacterium]|nr:hypothetical protein [Acidobacteriota bacterium]
MALERSLPLMPGDAAAVIKSMLTPASIAIMVGTLVVWAGSHFFGIGEIVDAILLLVGFVAIGFSVVDLAGRLYKFGDKSLNAATDQDLDKAARHFARAVSIAGVTVNNLGKVTQARPGLPNVGKPPVGPIRIQRVTLASGRTSPSRS